MNRATRVAAWLCASAALLAGCASEVRREPVELARSRQGEQGRRFSNGGDVEAMPESRTRAASPPAPNSSSSGVSPRAWCSSRRRPF